MGQQTQSARHLKNDGGPEMTVSDFRLIFSITSSIGVIVRKALAGNCAKAYAKHNNSEIVSASLLKKAERWARHGRCGKR